MKIYKPLLLIAAFIFFSTETILAGDCPVLLKPSEELKRATHVFSGKVIAKEHRKITDTSDENFGGQRLFVKFKVDRWWKGSGESEVILRTSTVYLPDGTTQESGEGFHFLTYENYLVYAFYYKGALGTNACTRTRKLSEAKEDLKELGKGFLPLKVNNQKHGGKGIVSKICAFKSVVLFSNCCISFSETIPFHKTDTK